MKRWITITRALVLCVTTVGLLWCLAGGNAMGKTVIQFAGLTADDFQAALKLVIAQFEADNPDIEIDNMIITGNLAEKLKVMLATGTAPDVFWVSTGLFAEWGNAGFLYDMNELEKRYRTTFNLDDFWPGALQTYQYKGRLYGLPREINMAMMFYNKNIFDTNGIAYPSADPNKALEWRTTFPATARKATRDINGDGLPENFGWQMQYAWWEWLPIFWSNGAELFDNDVTKSLFNSAQGAEVLQHLVDLIHKDRVAPTAADITRLSLKAHYANLAAGQVAMVIDNSIPITFLRNQPNVDWDVAAIPGWAGKKRVNLASGGGFAMNKVAKNPDAAFRWLAYVTGPKASRIWARTSGWVPARRSAAASPDFLLPNVPPASLGLVVQDAINVRAIPSTPKWALAFNTTFQGGLGPIWSNQKPAQLVLDDLARQVDAVLNQ